MVQAPEAVGDITLDKPGRPFPGLGYLRQRGMAAAAGTETMRAAGEPRFIIRFQENAHYFADEFIRPRRQAERPQFAAALLRDVNPSRWLEPVALVAQRIDDPPDLGQG